MFKSIKFKLIGLAVLPLLVALYFMVSSIAAKYKVAGEMDDMLTLSRLAVNISALVHETQKERGATGVFMGSDGAKFATELSNQRTQTDRKKADLEKLLESIDPDSYGREFSQALNNAVSKLASLDEHRIKVSNQSIPDNQGLAFYTQHNGLMLDVVNLISKSSKDAEIGSVGTAYVNFLQGKERAGIERAVMSKTFAADRFEEGTLRKFGGLVSEQNSYFNVFRSLATPDKIAFYEQKMSDPVVAEVQRMRDIAFKMGEVKTEGFGVKADHWYDSITKKINLMKEVENRLSEDLAAMAQNKQGDLESLLQLSVAISGYVHETQKERGLTAGFVGSKGKKFVSELAHQRRLADTKRKELGSILGSLETDSFSQGLLQSLEKAADKMNALEGHRGKVDARSIPDQEAIGFYTRHNALMLDVVAAVSKSATDAEIKSQLIGYINFLQGKERAGIERAVMSKTFAADMFEAGTLRKFGGLVSEQSTYFNVFRSLATPDQIAFYERKMSDPVVAEVQRMRDIAFKMGVVTMQGFGVDVGHWFKSMTSKINLMKQVEDRLSEDQIKLALKLKAGARSTLIMLGLVALAVVIAVGVAIFFIIRSITSPIQAAVKVADRIAENDLTVSITSTGKDEIGQLLSAMERMVENLSQTISSNTSAAELVSQAASEQASSLEETSSSLEEMASMTRQNADNSSQADSLMKESNQIITKANESMNELIRSMEEISNASEETSKIIKTIDEIAFQTNLLALNAAVEAARAGEAGAGFAVVADEVRNLAMRAADAAKNTADLIEGTVRKVKDGSELVTRTNEAFSQVATGTAKVSELVGEIAAASNEQAQGIEQVNTAIAEMDKVTQQNAATSEEMAASMATFKIRNDHSAAPTAATRRLHAAPVQQVASKAVTVRQALAHPAPMKEEDFKDF